jgi:hypothetical protein
LSSEELRELRKLSKILLLANSEIIERELSKFASTNERKKMWVLMDGQRTPKDLAIAAKVTPQAVSYYLGSGKAAGLIEYSAREPPRRILDYVPPAWLDIAELQKDSHEQSEVVKPIEKPAQ